MFLISEKLMTYAYDAPTVDPAHPVTLTSHPVLGVRPGMFADANGTANYNGNATQPAQFPEAMKAALSRLLVGPPDVVFVIPGSNSGYFDFGGADDTINGVACEFDSGGVHPNVILGVVDGRTEEPITWPTVQTVAGQPCRLPNARASSG